VQNPTSASPQPMKAAMVHKGTAPLTTAAMLVLYMYTAK